MKSTVLIRAGLARYARKAGLVGSFIFVSRVCRAGLLVALTVHERSATKSVAAANSRLQQKCSWMEWAKTRESICAAICRHTRHGCA